MTWREWSLVVVLAVASVVLTGCGGESSEERVERLSVQRFVEYMTEDWESSTTGQRQMICDNVDEIDQQSREQGMDEASADAMTEFHISRCVAEGYWS